ncbi:hypothetical protein ACFW5I_37310 [Streptomyces sp. NPDC058818]|uniref:hypothetical protein n=1 Tax=Streptomyces sp. NPDC058818 TaxID=3346640 RepID=UPI003678F588
MTMTPAELKAQKDTLELLNNEVASRLTRQSDSLAKIDTKAVFLLGFARGDRRAVPGDTQAPRHPRLLRLRRVRDLSAGWAADVPGG